VPELPEVETIARDLAPLLQGRRIVDGAIEWPGVLDGMAVDDFRREVSGRRLERASRRGKYVLIFLSGDRVLSVHLKMSGQLVFRPVGSPPDRFVRAVLYLEGGDELRFADARKFGRIRLLDQAGFQALESNLGPEPLSAEFTVEKLASLLEGRSARIKPLLLDQRFIAGIGNIYADEALFVAGIHPMRQANSLSPQEVQRLRQAIRDVLRASVVNRGTTFDSYRDGFGHQGSNQYALRVYRRHGKPCPRCGGFVGRIEVGGRGTHFCPQCQV